MTRYGSTVATARPWATPDSVEKARSDDHHALRVMDLCRLLADSVAEGWISTRRASQRGETNAFDVIIELTAKGRTMAEDIILQKQARRLEFLNALYDLTDGNPKRIGPPEKVGASIEATAAEAFDIASYLHREGLVELVNRRLSITHAGAKLIEGARTGSVNETEQFRPTVIYNVFHNTGSITGSTIQQAGHDAHQAVGVNQEVRSMLEQFLRDLRADLARAPDSDEKRYVAADAKAMEEELALPKPRAGTLKERLVSIGREVAKTTLVNVVSAGVMKGLAAIVALL